MRLHTCTCACTHAHAHACAHTHTGPPLRPDSMRPTPWVYARDTCDGRRWGAASCTPNPSPSPSRNPDPNPNQEKGRGFMYTSPEENDLKGVAEPSTATGTVSGLG